MVSNASSSRRSGQSLLTVGTLAGLAGGVMEIVWIMLYQSLSGSDAAVVARGVTASVFPDLATAPASVLLGIGIHMALAVGLGIAIAAALPTVLPRIVGTFWEPALVVLGLAGVWAVNFFVLLPVINAEFVTIVPLAASFISKLLFGFAAAFTFWAFRRRPAAEG